jgi:hypothetical protein
MLRLEVEVVAQREPFHMRRSPVKVPGVDGIEDEPLI